MFYHIYSLLQEIDDNSQSSFLTEEDPLRIEISDIKSDPDCNGNLSVKHEEVVRYL